MRYSGRMTVKVNATVFLTPTESIVDKSSVVVRDLELAVLLYCTRVVFDSFVEIHPQIFDLSSVVIGCGQTGSLAVPATTRKNPVHNVHSGFAFKKPNRSRVDS